MFADLIYLICHHILQTYEASTCALIRAVALTFQTSFLSSEMATSVRWPPPSLLVRNSFFASRSRKSVPSLPYSTYPLEKPGTPPAPRQGVLISGDTYVRKLEYRYLVHPYL